MTTAWKHHVIVVLGFGIALWGLAGCGRQKADETAGGDRSEQLAQNRGVSVEETISSREHPVADVPSLVARLCRQCEPGRRGRIPLVPVDAVGMAAPPSEALHTVVEQLAQSTSPEVTPALTGLLESKPSEAAVRWAAEILGRRQDGLAIGPLWQAYAKTANSALRSHLARALSRLPREAVAIYCAAQLQEPDYQIRMAACEVLAACPHPVAVVPLCALLDTGATMERDKAIDALVAIGPPTVPKLIGLADGPQGNRALAAVMALSRIPSHGGLETVYQLSLHGNAMMRSDARNALRNAFSEQRRKEFERLGEENRRRYERLERTAFEIISASVANSPDEAVRCHGLDLMGEMSLPQASEFLQLTLNREQSPKVRAVAMKALQRRKDPQALSLAYANLISANERLRQEAAATLTRAGTKPDMFRLQPALGHPSPEVRRSALLVLGRLGGAEARRALIDHVVDPAQAPAECAAAALVAFPREPGDADWLALMARSPHLRCRREAATMLGKLATYEAVSLLVEMLGHPDMRTRQAAVDATGELEDPRLFEPLFEFAVAQVSNGLAKPLPPALLLQGAKRWPDILHWLESRDLQRKAVAAKVLEHVEAAEVRSTLHRLQLAGDREVTCNAPDAFVNPPDPDVVQVIARMIREDDWGGTLAFYFWDRPNPDLRTAARGWLYAHGYQIVPCVTATGGH